MNDRLALAFPWLFFALILGLIVRDQTRVRAAVATPAPAGAEAAMAGDAVRAADPGPDSPVARDPVCGMSVRKAAAHVLLHGGRALHFCAVECRDEFVRRPEAYAAPAATTSGRHLMRGVPTWMYQTGVAVVLVLSFGLFELVDRWKTRRVAGAVAALAPAAIEARFDLARFAFVRRLLRWAPLQAVVRGVMAVLFLGIVAAGLFGNQNPAMNIAPLLTWTIWWAGLVFLILFAGKAWCYMCPWDALATWLERLQFWGARRDGLGLGLKWPAGARNIWFAVGCFVLLTWIELGMGITLIPRATAWVALGMLGLAVVSALVFERKSFCRYGCLVGRVSGLYALFSAVELRSRDAQACAGCKTIDCFRGNARGDGCPTFEFPKVMDVSTYCILCTECARTCPHDNITLRLRPWGADLASAGKPRTDEAFLAVILLAMTGFHGLTMTPAWPRWNELLRAALGLSESLAFLLLMCAILVAPILLFAGLTAVAARWSRPHGMRALFIRYAYALLPIALFYHLAHNAEHFLMEGPKVLALASDPLGRGWNLFGTAGWTVPPLITLEGLWGIQVLMVLVGHVYSLWISDRTTRRLVPDRRAALFSQVPMLAAMVLFSVFSLWLLKQPMEMRSAM